MNTIEKAVKILNKKYGINKVDVAIVVGSGLINSAPKLENMIVVNYDQLGLPTSKVKGHSGSFKFGIYNGKMVALVSRMHYYESGDISKVRLPLEIISELGATLVILLTSCGGLNKSYRVGDVMLIKDQINMSGINPLIGMDEIKFVDMLDCYNLEFRKKVKKFAQNVQIELQEGVHAQMSGPSYETNAEVEMLRKLGADSVSMSTAHDCIIANYLGLKVVGFSVIVNVFNDKSNDLTHEEVLENAELACQKLQKILCKLI